MCFKLYFTRVNLSLGDETENYFRFKEQRDWERRYWLAANVTFVWGLGMSPEPVVFCAAENIAHGKEILGIGVPTSTKNMKSGGSVEVQKYVHTNIFST